MEKAFEDALIWAIRNKVRFQGPILEITEIKNGDIMYCVSYKVKVSEDAKEELIRTDMIYLTDMVEYIIGRLFPIPITSNFPSLNSQHTGTSTAHTDIHFTTHSHLNAIESPNDSIIIKSNS